MIVPPSISNWDAAAQSASHLFLLVGAVVLIPLILGYNSLAGRSAPGRIASDGGAGCRPVTPGREDWHMERCGQHERVGV